MHFKKLTIGVSVLFLIAFVIFLRVTPGLGDLAFWASANSKERLYVHVKMDPTPAVINELKNVQTKIMASLRRSQDGIVLTGIPEIKTGEGELLISPVDEDDIPEVITLIESQLRKQNPDPDVSQYTLSSDGATISVRVTEHAKSRIMKQAMDSAVRAIETRIKYFCNKHYETLSGGVTNKFVFSVPEDCESQGLIDVIGSAGKFSIHLVDRKSNIQEIGGVPPGRKLLHFPELEVDVPVYKKALLEGVHISDATSSSSPDGYTYQVNLAFTEIGKKRFFEVTGENVGELLAFCVDDEILTMPRINEPILSDAMRITGNMTATDAKILAAVIKSGAILTTAEVLKVEIVSPEM